MTKRREFIKRTGLAGINLAGASIIPPFASGRNVTGKSNSDQLRGNQRTQSFKMSGYTSPELDTICIGFIGLGSRGPCHVANMSLLEGV